MKVSTIFDETLDHKKLKPIELIKFIDNDYCSVGANGRIRELITDVDDPSYLFRHTSNVKLISRGDEFDIIAIWSDSTAEDKDLDNVGVYLGHWNDGVLP